MDRTMEELNLNIYLLNRVMEEMLGENRALRKEVTCLREEIERNNRLMKKEVR